MIPIKENQGLKGSYTFKVYKAGTDQILRQFSFDNLIVNSEGYGINVLLRAFAGLEGSVELLSLKIGTGDTAATDADDSLETPVAEVLRSLREVNGDSVLLTFFIPDALLPEQEYKEVGVGYGNDDTFRLFSRALLSPTYTKSVEEDLIVEYTLTVTNLTLGS